jgi:hypothetical protein
VPLIWAHPVDVAPSRRHGPHVQVSRGWARHVRHPLRRPLARAALPTARFRQHYACRAARCYRVLHTGVRRTQRRQSRCGHLRSGSCCRSWCAQRTDRQTMATSCWQRKPTGCQESRFATYDSAASLSTAADVNFDARAGGHRRGRPQQYVPAKHIDTHFSVSASGRCDALYRREAAAHGQTREVGSITLPRQSVRSTGGLAADDRA